MSDTYKIGSVTVAALGGGWYELKHDSLAEPRKVHGKEAADTEATKLSNEPEGHIQPQGGLPEGDLTPGVGGDIIEPGDDRSAAEKAQERAAGLPDPTPPAPPAEPAVEDPAKAAAKADEVAQLKEQLAAANEKNAALEAKSNDFETRFNDFLKSAQPLISSIETTGGDLPGVPLQAPRTYGGQMDPAARKMFKQQGIEVKTIVLEENESIPPTGLFIGHNGNSYMITPGEEVDVPDFLLGVLDDAIMSAPVVDAKSQKVLGYRNRSKYPYRLVK